jgi:hypothetical protein
MVNGFGLVAVIERDRPQVADTGQEQPEHVAADRTGRPAAARASAKRPGAASASGYGSAAADVENGPR